MNCQWKNQNLTFLKNLSLSLKILINSNNLITYKKPILQVRIIFLKIIKNSNTPFNPNSSLKNMIKDLTL